MDKTEHNKKAFLKALKANLGNISVACKVAGIGRSTYYNWSKQDPDFKREIAMLSEDVIDFVESKLYEQIADGNITAIIFFLKTGGAKRGFNENHLLLEEPSSPPKRRDCFVIGGRTIFFD